MEIIDSTTFKGKDFTKDKFDYAEYDSCTFDECNLANVNLSRSRFIDCQFIGCDLSNSPLHETSFQDCDFTDCKMLGLHFEDCNSFNISANFASCVMDDSSFYQMKLKKMKFDGCFLKRVDFTEVDASDCSFQDCTFNDAVFDRTNLQKADFRTATGFRIDPINNQVKGALFSKEGALGLLERFAVVVG